MYRCCDGVWWGYYFKHGAYISGRMCLGYVSSLEPMWSVRNRPAPVVCWPSEKMLKTSLLGQLFN